MAAYNAVNGTPAHVHPMWRDIVMREWGVDGIICTDGGGLRLLVDRSQGVSGSAGGGRRVHQGRHQQLPRPAAGAARRGREAGPAGGIGSRRRPARPVPRVAALGLLDPARARAVRAHRRARRSRAVGEARDSRVRPRGHAQVDRAAQELAPACCRSTARRSGRCWWSGRSPTPCCSTGTPARRPTRCRRGRASSAWPRRRPPASRAVGVTLGR